MNNKVHWAFWVIAVLGLLWNVGGIMNYMMQMKPDFNATMPAIHQEIVNGRPAWATGAFAVGVFGGALGCILLLLRKPQAGLVLMISLMGIFITTIHTLGVVLSKDVYPVADIFIIIVLPIVVANLLIGFTFFSIQKKWIAGK